MTKNVEDLLRLIKENPDLPILPMVDSEVVADDCYGTWMGSFGNCEVGEYALYNDRYFDDREDFKEYYYDYNDDELCTMFNYEPRLSKSNFIDAGYTFEELKENEKSEQLLEEYLDKLADEYFIKAIIVSINVPE